MMNNDEILEYNKLCAKFLGMEFEIHSNTWRYKDLITTQLLFHSDWNLIIMMVEAIEKLGYITKIIENGLVIEGELVLERWGETKKEGVIKTIYQFLKYHNENK